MRVGFDHDNCLKTNNSTYKKCCFFCPITLFLVQEWAISKSIGRIGGYVALVYFLALTAFAMEKGLITE